MTAQQMTSNPIASQPPARLAPSAQAGAQSSWTVDRASAEDIDDAELAHCKDLDQAPGSRSGSPDHALPIFKLSCTSQNAADAPTFEDQPSRAVDSAVGAASPSEDQSSRTVDSSGVADASPTVEI